MKKVKLDVMRNNMRIFFKMTLPRVIGVIFVAIGILALLCTFLALATMALAGFWLFIFVVFKYVFMKMGFSENSIVLKLFTFIYSAIMLYVIINFDFEKLWRGQ